jgi:protein SCO1
MRQMQRVQGQLRGLVERVVVAMPEGQACGIETAGAIPDQVDNRLKFVGHGNAGAQKFAEKTAKYSGRAVIMVVLPTTCLEPDAMFNRTTLLILLVALATGAGLVAAEYVYNRQAATEPELTTVRRLSQPRELPGFQLQQSDRTQLIPGELRGHWTVVFLGFTACPDICPTTLAQLAQAQKRWESLPESVRPRVLFVSVDPERDTVERIGEYAHSFHKDTLAATADIPALERFTKSLSLVFAKVPQGEGATADQYTIDHSSALVLLDPQGRMAGVIQQTEHTPLQPKAIAEDLIALTKEGR